MSMKSVTNEFEQAVEIVFDEGKSVIVGNDSRAFTGQCTEELGRYALQLCCDDLNLDATIDQKYIVHPKLDRLRLDDHLHIDGKIVIMQEDRAWVDKPFFHQKQHAIHQITHLPHGIAATIKDCIFPILGLAIDVTPVTRYTARYEYNPMTSYGVPRIRIFSISGHPRDSKRGYFYRGFSSSEIKSYVSYIYKHLKKYANGELER